jgi:hypothetical protein
MNQRKLGGANGDVATMSLLGQEQQTHIDKARAAYYLRRKPRKMRVGICRETTGSTNPS